MSCGGLTTSSIWACTVDRLSEDGWACLAYIAEISAVVPMLGP